MESAAASPATEVAGQLVPMAQMRLWNQGSGLLGTRSLGSCVAVMIRESSGRRGGLAHCMLPLSQLDSGVAQIEPCTFTDSGIAALRDALLREGAHAGALEAFMVGGASLLGDTPSMRMGPRNVQVAQMLLDQFEIRVKGEDVGGQLPRSVWFNPAAGWVDVFCAGQTARLEGES